MSGARLLVASSTVVNPWSAPTLKTHAVPLGGKVNAISGALGAVIVPSAVTT